MEADQNRAIAFLLQGGTWAASALLAIGLLLPGQPGTVTRRAGVALFILLPSARVLLMLVQFLRRRERLYAGIALLVLAVIGAGLFVGL